MSTAVGIVLTPSSSYLVTNHGHRNKVYLEILIKELYSFWQLFLGIKMSLTVHYFNFK